MVSVRGLTKRFRRRGTGEDIIPVNNVSIDVMPNETVVLLGPSGCGKTTLLRCVAGLEHADEGEIWIDGELVFSASKKISLPPEKRRLSMIFQSYALWPHMTVFDNVAYPLRARRVSRRELTAQVAQALSTVGLGNLADQYPSQISGGQQQRVAVARAVVAGDRLVLMDEPLSNVDAKVREQLRFELVRMQQELGFSSLYVTHDQVEAMQLASRVAVLDAGTMVQLDTPSEVYRRPSTVHVGEFIGSANIWDGQVLERRSTGILVTTPLGEVWIERGADTSAPASSDPQFDRGDGVSIISRPENWRIHKDAGGDGWTHAVTVVGVLFSGSHIEYVVTAAGRQLRIWSFSDVGVAPGDEAYVTIDNHLFHAIPCGESSLEEIVDPDGSGAAA